MPLLLVCFIRRKRNDAWGVLYNGLFLTNPYFTGAQSVGSAPLFHPTFRPFTNLNRFYPVAERAAVAALPIPLDGIGRAAAGIRSTANGNTKMCTTKRKGQKIPLVEGLEGS